MNVIATATGYDNVAVRNEGDVFACPKNAKGEFITKSSWYKPVEEKTAADVRKDAKAARDHT